MGNDANSHGDGPFSRASDSTQSTVPPDQWEQPCIDINRRGRPSNWTKKLLAQQYKDMQEAASQASEPSSAQPVVANATAAKRPAPRKRKAPAPKTVKPPPQPAVPAPEIPVPQVPSPRIPGIDDDPPLFVGDSEPDEPQPAQKHPAEPTIEDLTRLKTDLSTIADEVRRWEEVTQQVAIETQEMANLVKNLAASSFSSKPPSAVVVRDMLSPQNQARFRDQLLKATQLSLEADLVQTLKERDSETREQQVCCVVVLAVAVVVAAFLVSPFAGWVVEWLDWFTSSAL